MNFKARVSLGYQVREYIGSFGFKESSLEAKVSTLDADKTISVYVDSPSKQEERVKNENVMYMQFSILYDTIYGERKIRVFNKRLSLSQNIGAYYTSIDQEILSQFIVRKEVSKVMDRGIIQTKEALLNGILGTL